MWEQQLSSRFAAKAALILDHLPALML